jgi:hypothetical protein
MADLMPDQMQNNNSLSVAYCAHTCFKNRFVFVQRLIYIMRRNHRDLASTISRFPGYVGIDTKKGAPVAKPDSGLDTCPRNLDLALASGFRGMHTTTIC